MRNSDTKKVIDEYEAKIVKLGGTMKTVTSNSTETAYTQTIISSTTISQPTQTDKEEKEASTQTTNEANSKKRATKLEKTIQELNMYPSINKHIFPAKQILPTRRSLI